jgi:hypothetical protein
MGMRSAIVWFLHQKLMIICRGDVYGGGNCAWNVLRKGKAITWLESLIRVKRGGLVRNGGWGQVTLREKEQFIARIT